MKKYCFGIGLLAMLATPNVSADFISGDMTLRDAIYLYDQGIDARGSKTLGGYNCDVFQLVLDVTSGFTDLAMFQGNNDAELSASTLVYPDRIFDSAAMFSYALYRNKAWKRIRFSDVTQSALAFHQVGTGTIFGYCYSTKPDAYVYFVEEDKCTVKYSDGYVGTLPNCVPSTPRSATEQEVRQMVDNTLSIITGAGGAAGMTALFSDMFIFSETYNPSSTCPQVTTDPPDLLELEDMPPSMTLSANYAAGCTSSAGSSMSGSATLAFSNLSSTPGTESSPFTIAGDFSLTLNNLKQNGVLLGNGQITGNANLVISLNPSSGQSSGTANIQLTNLVLSTGISLNGTIAMTLVSNTQQNVGINVTTSKGPMVLNLKITESATTDGITVNTTSTGNLENYSTTINNLQLNPTACGNYPVGGTISFTKNSQTSSVTFNGSCDGNYSYTGP